MLSTALLLVLPPVAHLYPERLSYEQHVQVDLWLIVVGTANLVAMVIAVVRLAGDQELRVPWNFILLTIAGGWWAVFLTDWLQLAGMVVTGGN